MTETEWLTEVEQNKDKLISLIECYHPASSRKVKTTVLITAPNVERALVGLRKVIEKEFEGSPVEVFKFALAQRDWKRINYLLNDAWFGVPESTACWGITGFSEACSLMEDIPMMNYHRNFDDYLRKQYLDLARVCFILGIIFGVVIGAATHHWWYHSF